MSLDLNIMDIDKSSSGLANKLTRKMAQYRHRKTLTPKFDRPIVSFSFDDCPKSVVDTALPLLEAEGWHSTIYMACGLCDITNHLGLHMSLADIQASAKTGHEIGDHTYHHLDGLECSLDVFMADIDQNQEVLATLGLPPSRTFAYPYGQVSSKLKKAMQGRFELSRGIKSSSDAQVYLGLSPSTRLYAGVDIDIAIKRIGELVSAPKWEILFTHDVRNTPSDYGCTEADLKKVIKAVKDSEAIVLPIAKALDHVRTLT